MPRGIPKGTKLKKTVTHRVEGQKLILEIDLSKFVMQALSNIMREKGTTGVVDEPEEDEG